MSAKYNGQSPVEIWTVFVSQHRRVNRDRIATCRVTSLQRARMVPSLCSMSQWKYAKEKAATNQSILLICTRVPLSICHTKTLLF